jgi:6-phosphogluconolactonase (cycloisomerase 2 family)
MDSAGKFVYVANEDDSNVSGFTVSPTDATLSGIANSPFGVGGALRPIASDTSGKFVYVGSYGTSKISAFSIHAGTGALDLIGTVNTGNGVKGVAPFGIATSGTLQ